ncbi:MAG: hypothetical protein PUB21_11590 [Bacteroidales bacterium]|nr:hypothetical protein [Bacteroidales bacterium]
MSVLGEVLTVSMRNLEMQYRIPVERCYERFSFGDKASCEEIFMEALRCVDKTSEMVKLPEYDAVIDWMADTKGQGLLLTGAHGRGKTTILCGVIPLLFRHFMGKVVRPVYAEQIPEKMEEVLASRFVCIDDFGTEGLVSVYGERYEGLNRILNDAENRLKPTFLSTNLNGSRMLDRYGMRMAERILRLCRVVEFRGESMRKRGIAENGIFDFNLK